MRTCNILLYAVFSTSLFFLYFRDLSALSIFHFSAALAPLFPAIGVKSSGRPLIVFLFFLDYLSLPLSADFGGFDELVMNKASAKLLVDRPDANC